MQFHLYHPFDKYIDINVKSRSGGLQYSDPPSTRVAEPYMMGRGISQND